MYTANQTEQSKSSTLILSPVVTLCNCRFFINNATSKKGCVIVIIKGSVLPAVMWEKGGLVAPVGFEVIPEEVVAMLGEDGAELGAEQRQADAAIASWRMGKAQSGSWTGASVLSLSARASDIDLKEFLKHRGRYCIL